MAHETVDFLGSGAVAGADDDGGCVRGNGGCDRRMAIRIVSLLHTIKMHDYTELTGTCTKREVSPLTKKQKIIFRSTDQKEYHFTFDKNIRLLSGHYYRLYFRNVANLSGEEKVTPDLLAYEELSLNEDVSPKNS